MRALDLQQQMKRIGKIRLGEQQQGDGPGKRLWTFRLTSNDRRPLDVAAERYKGTVTRWQPNGKELWQVTTLANELPIEISNVASSTQYEMWGQLGGKGTTQCIRRCDGCNIVEGQERGQACKCPEDPRERAALAKQKGQKACQLNCRIWVRLPELPDIGYWQATTNSFYAAREVPAMLDGIEALAAMGARIRAMLAIDRRTGGGNTFPVLAVRLIQSHDELLALAESHFEKMAALEGADKMQQLAFKLGLPMAVVDGQLIRTVHDVAPALEANAGEGNNEANNIDWSTQ